MQSPSKYQQYFSKKWSKNSHLYGAKKSFEWQKRKRRETLSYYLTLNLTIKQQYCEQYGIRYIDLK